MTNTGQTPMYPGTMHPRLEDQMTSYELLAADRSKALHHRMEERTRRATLLDDASGHRRLEPTSRRWRLRLSVMRPA